MSREMTKEDYDLQFRIVLRAEGYGLINDRLTFMIDTDYAIKQWDIDLSAWLYADKVDFAHDVIGIQQNIDRQFCSNHHKPKFDNCFMPRFARS